MKNVIITGASGMIGSMVLQKCLDHPDIIKVTSVVRKSSGIHHHKLYEVIHHDFLNFDDIAFQFNDQDICFFCIGVYTGSVPKDEFRKITVEYTEAFAKTLRENSSETTLCFLSGAGADQTEKSSLMFARDKGAAENILAGLNFNNFYSFRPGYIYPSVQRKEPNLAYKIFKIVYKPVSVIYPNIGLTSENLSAAMVKVGMNGYRKSILENKDFRKIEKENS